MKDNEIISKLNELLSYVEMRSNALSFADRKPSIWTISRRPDQSEEYTTFRVVEEHNKLYQETLCAIYNKGNIRNRYVRENFEREVQTFLMDIKEKQATVTESSFNWFFNRLNDTQKRKISVFHKIYGLIIDEKEPVHIGCFTLYNYSLHKDKLLQTTPYHSIEELVEQREAFVGHDNWICTEIDGVDEGKAYELACNRFEVFQGICQYTLDLEGLRPHAICILNDVVSAYDVCYMFSGGCAYGKGEPDFHRTSDININDLLYGKYRIFEALVERLSSDEKNEVTNRLKNVFITYGRTIYEHAKSQQLIMFVTIVESLVEFDRSNLSESIARYLAAMVSNDCQTFGQIREHYKALYDKRSEIAHGSSVMATDGELWYAKHYAIQLISCFINDTKIQSIKKNEDLKEYLDKKANGFEEKNP